MPPGPHLRLRHVEAEAARPAHGRCFLPAAVAHRRGESQDPFPPPGQASRACVDSALDIGVKPTFDRLNRDRKTREERTMPTETRIVDGRAALAGGAAMSALLGGSGDGAGAAADLRAGGPGGGWDQTARTMEQVLRTRKADLRRPDHQCRRRRRHGRPAAVRQPVEGPAECADGRRHGDGRRDHRQQVARSSSTRRHADRPADRRVRGAGGAGRLAVQDREGLRRRAEGRSRPRCRWPAARPAAPTTSCSA